MSFIFREQFTAELPHDLVADHTSIQEAVKEAGTNAGLIVEIAAIHAGYTENNTVYSAEELRKSIPSWVAPYPKPVIMNHDIMSEPVGRIVGAKMDMEPDGKEFIRIQAQIADPEAIQKILDKRYITGSVGGKAQEATCNICNADWASASAFGKAPCKHIRGKVYNGTMAALLLKGLSFKEYSFVNAPADTNSYVRDVKDVAGDTSTDSTEDDGWVKSSKFFLYSLSDAKVKEYDDADNGVFGISEAEVNYLDTISKNYQLLFVDNESTLDTNENVKSSLLQEFFMQNENTEQEVEDVAALTEQLLDDLAPATDVVEGEDITAESTTEDTVEESEEIDDTEDQISESELVTEDTDVTENSEDTDIAEEVVEDSVDETTEDVAESTEESENGLDTEESVEPEIANLIKENEALKEENLSLKKALHRTLAERVVDTKIALGFEELSNRTTLIEDHSGRTASSLADALRDLAKMPAPQKQVVAVENLSIDQDLVAVEESGESASTEGEDVQEKVEETTPQTRFVEVMTNVLSGKTNLH